MREDHCGDVHEDDQRHLEVPHHRRRQQVGVDLVAVVERRRQQVDAVEPGGVAEQGDEELAVDGDVLGVVRDQVPEGDRQQ